MIVQVQSLGGYGLVWDADGVVAQNCEFGANLKPFAVTV